MQEGLLYLEQILGEIKETKDDVVEHLTFACQNNPLLWVVPIFYATCPNENEIVNLFYFLICFIY